MSLYDLFSIIFIGFVIKVALSPSSKTCKINTVFTTNEFKLTFETNEKSTPSDQE
ncbi:hypothetical protein I3900191A7_00530 [Clostridium baratii]|uniref:hypothetical protein n=1 Tax=Clostridium baratii TaxID=1561 RepID=UPI002A760FCF|nr:hypothetical protein [Clostridium baratii]MDY3206548.1 hypothetical protein [Clostridium baratii]